MRINEIIEPIEKESPISYAEELGLRYAVENSQNDKKDKGQFFTPAAIAGFMANLFENTKEAVTILDPGCGMGILSCALIENLVKSKLNLKKIALTAYETDSDVIPHAKNVFSFLRNWLNRKNIEFEFTILNKDFVLENASMLSNEEKIFSDNKSILYDMIISNPPYFKLSKTDHRAKAAELVINGQPNIYALFMAIASKMLNDKGQMVFITPRSFTSGRYFKAFRKFLFENISIDYIHIFDSRKKTFENDNVLQETIIIRGTKTNISNNQRKIRISNSNNISDLLNVISKKYDLDRIIDLKSKDKVLHIPTNDEEDRIMKLFSSWEGTLEKYNIQISTGPVVAFRAADFINDFIDSKINYSPLIWLHNVLKMQIIHPIEKPNKGQYFKVSNECRNLLVPNKNYILLRRFSSKDDKSRLVAAPYFSDMNKSKYLAIENKVNYIYRPNGELSIDEILGLSALLNSKLFDTYFRMINGNINVSATELRQMHLPSIDTIKSIGNQLIPKIDVLTSLDIDDLISQFIKVI